MQENHLDNHKTPHTMKNKIYYLFPGEGIESEQEFDWIECTEQQL
jgi:hypothetical protein